MRRVERILGNVHAATLWRKRFETALATGALETATLSPWDAQKRRLRVTTDAGSELGLILTDDTTLGDGAVLEYDEASGHLTVVRVPGQRLLVLTIEGDEAETTAMRGVRLGHVLGNQHWPARVEGRRVEVALPIDERVVRTVLETYQLDGVRYEFVDAPGLPEPNLTADPSHRHAHPHPHHDG